MNDKKDEVVVLISHRHEYQENGQNAVLLIQPTHQAAHEP